MKPRAFQENRVLTTLCIRTAEVTFKSLNTVYDEALFRLCLFIFNKSKKRTPVSSELTVLDKTQKLYKHQRWYYMKKRNRQG